MVGEVATDTSGFQLHQRTIALVFLSLSWFLIISGRLAVSTFVVRIEGEFAIDHDVIGLALSGMWLAYGAMQFPSGVISDLTSRKTTVLLALVFFTAGCLLIGLANAALMFVFVMILFGIGTGFFQTPSITMVSDLYTEKRGRALGIQSSFASLAGVMPILLPIVALAVGWRPFFFVWTLAALATCIGFKIAYTTPPARTAPTPLRDRLAGAMTIFRDRRVLMILAVNLSATFAWLGFLSFYPTYLITGKGLSELHAGIGFGLLSLGGFAMKPLIGNVADRYSKKIVIAILLVGVAGASVAVVISESVVALLVLSPLLSITTSIFIVVNAYLMELWPEAERGSKLGLYRSFTILIGSPTAALIGVTAIRSSFDTPFLVLALMMIGGAVLVLASALRDDRR